MKFPTKLPVNPGEVIKQGKLFKEQGEKQISIGLLVDPLASDEMIAIVSSLLTPQTLRCRVVTRVIGTDTIGPHSTSKYDFIVCVLSTPKDGATQDYSEALIGLVGKIVDSRRKLMIVTTSIDAESVAEHFRVSILDIVDGSNREACSQDIARWCAEEMSDIRLALAVNFPFMRESVATEFIKATALQNAIVGGLLFIPGADLPVMTLNQIKMMFQVAAVYGEPISIERAKEVAAIVAGGFTMRTVAREFVGVIPFLGWAIKAAIGYGATYGMGIAVVQYFAGGGQVAQLGQHLLSVRDEIVIKSREAMAKTPGISHRTAQSHVPFKTRRGYIESNRTRG
ncbi:MAG: hypothetical protein JJE36_05725 [Coriobacteriia bacterium]|nr:hypothetical protein [Coriobacteriia bacterium]